MTQTPSTFSEIKSAQFWNSIVPDLLITEAVPLAQQSSFGQALQIDENLWNVCRQTLQQDGYFAYDSWLDASFVTRLANAIRQLDLAGWPPIFAFVFDEFWDVLLQLDPLLSDLVDDYEIPSAIWAWLVDQHRQTSFKPHRDQVREAAVDDEDHLDYLTIWIPLTDLDHLSSNICLLPASRDTDYDQGTERVNVPDLQAIRCLQGRRGSVFCWTTGLVHWGTHQTAWNESRISLGACIQHPDAVCFDPPLLDFHEPLFLKQRLAIIGQQIINYSREADQQQLQLAQQLVDDCDQL